MAEERNRLGIKMGGRQNLYGHQNVGVKGWELKGLLGRVRVRMGEGGYWKGAP